MTHENIRKLPRVQRHRLAWIVVMADDRPQFGGQLSRHAQDGQAGAPHRRLLERNPQGGLIADRVLDADDHSRAGASEIAVRPQHDQRALGLTGKGTGRGSQLSQAPKDGDLPPLRHDQCSSLGFLDESGYARSRMNAANDRRIVRAVLMSPPSGTTQLATSLPQLFLRRLPLVGRPSEPGGLAAMYQPDIRAAKRCLTEGECDSLAVGGGRAVDAHDDRPVITQFHHGDHPPAV